MKVFYKLFYIKILFIVQASFVFGQTCNGNITLSSQAEVDTFSCQIVNGDLIISGADISDLSPIVSLQKVTGHLIIDNTSLIDFDLPNLYQLYITLDYRYFSKPSNLYFSSLLFAFFNSLPNVFREFSD